MQRLCAARAILYMSASELTQSRGKAKVDQEGHDRRLPVTKPVNCEGQCAIDGLPLFHSHKFARPEKKKRAEHDARRHKATYPSAVNASPDDPEPRGQRKSYA